MMMMMMMMMIVDLYSALRRWIIEKRLHTCIVQNREFTYVNYSEYVETGHEAACDADHCIVEYLPSADSSQLFERLVNFHRYFVHTNSSSSSPGDDVSAHFSLKFLCHTL